VSNPFARIPSAVTIVEVGPRDGLQNEPQPVPVAAKIRLIEALADAGLGVIEAGAFVSPRWVPQMASSAEVLAGIRRRPGVRYPVLVPNAKGLERARAAGCDEIAVFAAATDTFSRKNLGAPMDDVLCEYESLVPRARASGLRVRGYVSCVAGCPYEGRVDIASVCHVAGRLYDFGCFEISLGDTIGVGTPRRILDVVRAVRTEIPLAAIALHAHDTYGQALANVLAALELGVAVIDASVAGLGGCPYAPGASGNVATEDVVYLLDGLGIRTGIDLDALCRAGEEICRVLGRETRSKVARARAGARPG
jgi:hydroxymethylglutaryl-CoA lyase